MRRSADQAWLGGLRCCSLVIFDTVAEGNGEVAYNAVCEAHNPGAGEGFALGNVPNGVFACRSQR